MGIYRLQYRKRTPGTFRVRWQYVGVLILLLLLGVWCLRLSAVHFGTANVKPAASAAASRAGTIENLSESRDVRTLRAVFPYSVIPGGIRSAQELQRDISADPVVRAHYAGFDMSKAHMIRLQREQLVYVSYRIGNEVYWTKHRLKLAKNEAVITDGTHTARSRCGNRVSDTRVLPTSPKEPAVLAMDTAALPELVPADGPNAPAFAPPLVATTQPPPAGEPFIPLVLMLPPGGGAGGPGGGTGGHKRLVGDPTGGDPPGNPPGGPPTAVPEPDTLPLLLISLPFLWMLGKRMKRLRR
jgi:hypothetical protein